eukprot:530050-Hanusia_phi.AAC.1
MHHDRQEVGDGIPKSPVMPQCVPAAVGSWGSTAALPFPTHCYPGLPLCRGPAGTTGLAAATPGPAVLYDPNPIPERHCRSAQRGISERDQSRYESRWPGTSR